MDQFKTGDKIEHRLMPGFTMTVESLLHDLSAETEAEREAEREQRSVAEHKCPRCQIARLNRCRDEDGSLMDRPHPERVKLVKEA